MEQRQIYSMRCTRTAHKYKKGVDILINMGSLATILQAKLNAMEYGAREFINFLYEDLFR